MRAKKRGWETVPEHFKQYRIGPLSWLETGDVAKLEAAVFPEPLPWSMIVRRLASPNTAYLAARADGHLAAYFGFEILGRYAHVISNVTHPRHRRQGLAQFLLTAAEPLARARGAVGFLGEVRAGNLPQLAVLASIGWERVAFAERFFQNDEGAHIVWHGFVRN